MGVENISFIAAGELESTSAEYQLLEQMNRYGFFFIPSGKTRIITIFQGNMH